MGFEIIVQTLGAGLAEPDIMVLGAFGRRRSSYPYIRQVDILVVEYAVDHPYDTVERSVGEEKIGLVAFEDNRHNVGVNIIENRVELFAMQKRYAVRIPFGDGSRDTLDYDLSVSAINRIGGSDLSESYRGAHKRNCEHNTSQKKI